MEPNLGRIEPRLHITYFRVAEWFNVVYDPVCIRDSNQGGIQNVYQNSFSGFALRNK